MTFLAYPANYYGLATGIVVISTGCVFIPLLFLYIKSPYMENRGSALVLLSNLAYLFLAGGSAIYYLYFPESGCEFDLWSRYLKFSVYGFSLLLRAWIYAFKYHHAQSQVQRTRTSMAMAWCLKRKWLVSPKFLAPVWIINFLIHMTFPVLIKMLTPPEDMVPVVATSGCTSPIVVASTVNWIIPALYAGAVLVLVFKLRTSNDAFHIRDELRAVAVIWAVCTVLWLLTGVLPPTARISYLVPGFFWVQLSYILSFFVSTIWVWKLCREHGPSCLARRTIEDADIVDTTTSFPGLLRDEAFRKEFCNFLCLQFCVENLFFWEAVQHYHRVSPHEMKGEAKAIYEKYLQTGAACEVNIPLTVKKVVDAQLKEGIVSDTIFDDAASQALKLMELDSYPRFISRPGTRPKQSSQNYLL